MKKLHSKKGNKIIVLILAVIMLCNFAIPKKVNAVTTGNGGSALEPLAKLLCFIPDAVNNILQNTFVSKNNIKDGDEYKILYSPGIIFSGEVPAFDINFIKPLEEIKGIKYSLDSRDGIYLSGGGSLNDFHYVAYEAKTYMGNNFCAIDEVTTETYNQDIWSKIEKLFGDEYQFGTYENFWNLEDEEITIQFGDNREITILITTYSNNLYVKAYVKSIDGKTFTIDEENTSEEWPYGFGVIYYHFEPEAIFENNEHIIRREFESALYGIMNEENSLPQLKSDTDRVYNLLMKKYEEIKNMDSIPTISIIDFVHECDRSKNEEGKFIIEYNPKSKENTSEICWRVYYVPSYAYPQLTPYIYYSTSKILQPIIASWYKALRRIALVGLLSVLVYLGIRIVLSSNSAQDKAKYKKILKNWFEAVCLLFMLHYIMSLTINVVTQINNIVGTSVMGQNGEDVLLTKLRNEIYNAGGWAEVISQVVIYATITVYTIIFTIQYLRRTIYMAFLTIIAPLITLTYPIDKVKDSKAQAFDMWLKDYIFFSLLQVLHLLIYYIFVSQAIDLSEVGTKWSLVYSIVAIGFLTQAEKIMKKMFGFQKSKSMGALAAGATGALIMNLLNKASFGKIGKAPKGSSSSAGGGSIRTSSQNAGVRTQTINPLAGLQNIDVGQDTQTSEIGGEGNSIPTGNEDVSSELPNSNRRSHVRGRSTTSGSRTGGTPSQSTNNAITQSGNSMGGLKLSKNINRNTINKKDKTHYLKGLKSLAGKYTGPALSKLGGLVLGGAGTLIGFSAGVAQGDIGKALTGAVAGGSAGYYGGQKLVNAGVNALDMPSHIKENVQNIEDTFNEGARGKEYVKNQRFDRAFRASDDFRRLMDENPKTPDEYIQKMLDAGITEYKDMSKILSKNKEHPRKYSIDKAIGYTTLAKQCPYSILNNDKKFIKFCQDREIEITPEEAKAVRKVIIEFK